MPMRGASPSTCALIARLLLGEELETRDRDDRGLDTLRREFVRRFAGKADFRARGEQGDIASARASRST